MGSSPISDTFIFKVKNIYNIIYNIILSIAQLVERGTVVPQVAGSSPAAETFGLVM